MRNKLFIIIVGISFLASCKAYKQNIMFTHDDDFTDTRLSAEARVMQRNYVIQRNDKIQINVYTKNGEVIIDPEFELSKNINQNSRTTRPDPEYLVKLDGKAFLPMIGDIELAGLTLHEANKKLSDLFNEYFSGSYVITKYTNKRVVVLGAPGGQILPLGNENITIAEVLAMSGGMDDNWKANSIKLIRGEDVYLVDFSSVKGYYDTNQIVQAGDIIYVEPNKRLLSDNAREISVILSLLASLTTLILIAKAL